MIDPLAGLGDLPSAEPTAARAARIRRRCRAEMERRAVRAAPATGRRSRPAASPLWHMALATLCVAYVAEAIALALGLLQSR